MNLTTFQAQSLPAVGARGLWRRWGTGVIAAVVLALLAALVYFLLSGTASTKREVAQPPMLMLPPPPPPPPEPEKLPEPEIVKPVVREIEPTPVDKPVEKPADDQPPSPARDMGDPVSMNSDAQAGTDAFGIQAGRGGGTTGAGAGGLGAGSYNNYVSNLLQQLLQRDPRTRALSFDGLSVDLWMSADGRLTRLQLAKSSGDPQADELILATLRSLDRIEEKPPASMRLPMRLGMRGRRQ